MKTENYNHLVESNYEVFGFFKEYYLDGKYLGSTRCEYEEGRTLGYYGRTYEVFTETFLTDTNKRVPKGVKVLTALNPLCGRYKLEWDSTNGKFIDRKCDLLVETVV